MQIFISHSQQDTSTLEMFKALLDHERITYWESSKMLAGTSLTDQLIEGIKQSDVCIFIATESSINSSEWCKAELGAFWGAGKKVIIFNYNDKIAKDRLPPQFQTNFWTSKHTEVIRAAKVYIEMHSKERYGIVIDSHKDMEEIPHSITLSGSYHIKPVSELIMALVYNSRTEEYYPKNKIDYLSGKRWQTNIVIRGGGGEERTIKIASIRSHAQVIIDFHKKAFEKVKLDIKPEFIEQDIQVLTELTVRIKD